MALNRVILMGRITREPDMRISQNGTRVLIFTIAIDRGKDKDTDFIKCIAFNQRADFISRYFGKGRMIAIEGNLKSGSYEKNGQTIYTTDVWVDNVSFTGEQKTTDEGNFGGSASNASQYEEMANEDIISDAGIPL